MTCRRYSRPVQSGNIRCYSQPPGHSQIAPSADNNLRRHPHCSDHAACRPEPAPSSLFFLRCRILLSCGCLPLLWLRSPISEYSFPVARSPRPSPGSPPDPTLACFPLSPQTPPPSQPVHDDIADKELPDPIHDCVVGRALGPAENSVSACPRLAASDRLHDARIACDSGHIPTSISTLWIFDNTE